MDSIGWIVLGAAVLATLAVVALAPRAKKGQLRRQLRGRTGGSLAGVGAGFDAVWRPSAEEAHAVWDAQVELPAPAPTPGDRGRIEDGRLVIQLDADRGI